MPGADLRPHTKEECLSRDGRLACGTKLIVLEIAESRPYRNLLVIFRIEKAPLVPQACRQRWTHHIDPPHAESGRWPTPSASQPKHTIQSVAFDIFLSDRNPPRPRGVTFNGSACARCGIPFFRARKLFPHAPSGLGNSQTFCVFLFRGLQLGTVKNCALRSF